MILSNLSVLLSERRLTASKVSKDTGISRPTLTALTSGTGVGIQYDTLNRLCNYLRVTPNDIISYIPYDFKMEKVADSGTINPKSSAFGQMQYIMNVYFTQQSKVRMTQLFIAMDFKYTVAVYATEDGEERIPTFDPVFQAEWEYIKYPQKYKSESKLLEAWNAAASFYDIWEQLPEIFRHNIREEIMEGLQIGIDVLTYMGDVIPENRPAMPKTF